MTKEDSSDRASFRHIGDIADGLLKDIAEKALRHHLSRAADRKLCADDRLVATREARGILVTSIKAGLIKGQVAA